MTPLEMLDDLLIRAARKKWFVEVHQSEIEMLARILNVPEFEFDYDGKGFAAASVMWARLTIREARGKYPNFAVRELTK